jgi:quercetin dioxygenase-like cupin family protein
MPIVDRRTALQAFGIASISSLLSGQAAANRKAFMVDPGENRFDYSAAHLKKGAACKVTKEDSIGSCSIFELVTPPKGGPPRHIHHREDEWYYVLSGEYLFEVENDKYTLPIGASIWAPRDIPHVWANAGTTDGRIILMCQPGGFENFFDESAKGMMDKMTAAQMEAIAEKYGMEMLGPPLFPPQ